MLSTPRNTKKWGTDSAPELISLQVAAGTVIFKGSLVVIEGGYAVPGKASAGVVAIGRAEQNIDNSHGTAGEVWVDVRRGVFNWSNSSGADQITQANVGQQAYVVDDQTVGLTSNGGARAKAGLILAVGPIGQLGGEAGSVWVETNGYS